MQSATAWVKPISAMLQRSDITTLTLSIATFKNIIVGNISNTGNMMSGPITLNKKARNPCG
ncbi:hypothetical protein MC7420_4733 [Coleofasciculus chthonoplastes PCC 7420]|uniref:Uncharacterized protein n=1 Tax=Coleofasciculus chthonoplastes PCC 7420 TaxID=118168 RepID=B4VNC6_9CYAN|nr:hypothetical protein MC7420_4733 [Coleofasciculus chthonoplastes PCC 7420]